MTKTKTYRATFILDTRGQEQPVEKMIESLSQEISSLNAEIQSVENRGEKEFQRTPDKKFVKGVYLQFTFTAPPLQPNILVEKTRLNPLVNRVLTQVIDN